MKGTLKSTKRDDAMTKLEGKISKGIPRTRGERKQRTRPLNLLEGMAVQLAWENSRNGAD